MLRTSSLRVCTAADNAAVLAFLARDPVSNVFVASRIAAVGVDSWRLGGEVWAHVVGGQIESVCYAGANLIPAASSDAAVRSFADRARRQGRRCSSIVGPQHAVDPFWDLLEPSWGPARDVRRGQPLCVIDGPPAVGPDPAVRAVRPDELDILLPACVAMFTEEVGVSPFGADGGSLYRARVAELIGEGRAYARIEAGRVLFKAEVGAATDAACQVQGVWVAPEVRGTGLAAPGMAAVVDLARRDVAPVVSLYVNDYNAPARAAYARVGFRESGAFTSVLF